MKARKTEAPADGRAEGVIALTGGIEVPFDTAIVSSQGCHVHFWLGAVSPSMREEVAGRALSVARNARDVVSASWSENRSTGFWPREPTRFGVAA